MMTNDTDHHRRSYIFATIIQIHKTRREMGLQFIVSNDCLVI